MFRNLAFISLIAATTIAAPLSAGPVAFDKKWSTQRFSLFSSNKYGFGGNTLSVASDGAVSLAYTRLDKAQWGAKSARWSWSVSQSVPATDLTKKGGDDRDLSLYFVFLPQAEAEALGPKASVTKLLTAESARVLVYVWGDKRSRGAMISSPYLGKRGKTVLLRPAGTGSFSENVDLAADYRRAFGGEMGALVGLAVSADSDDTASVIRGQISGLSLN